MESKCRFATGNELGGCSENELYRLTYPGIPTAYFSCGSSEHLGALVRALTQYSPISGVQVEFLHKES